MSTPFRSLHIVLLAFVCVCASITRGQEQMADSDIERLVAEGYLAMQNERLREAERSFFQALRAQRDHKQARFGLGTLYIKMQNYERAARVLESLRTDFPQEYFILNNLAWLYATASDYQVRNGTRAVQLAQEALLLQPNDYHVWSTLAEGHYISGEYQRALRAAREALRLSREANAPETRQDEYRQQVTKSQRAAEALAILD